MYTVEFANIKLHDYCNIRNIKRSILPARENYSKTIPTMNGSYFTGFKYGEKTISLDIDIIGSSKIDFMNKVKKLADVLSVENPSRLILSDEPNIYYYAVLDGNSDIERLFNTGSSTITFLCHNPLGYSKDWKVFKPNNKIFTIKNNGTASAYPVVNVEFNSNSCFFQLTNYKGETVLIGKPKDITKPTVTEKEIIVEDNCSDSSNFIALSSSLIGEDRKAEGTFGLGNKCKGITCTNFGTEDEGKWNGVAFRKNLSSNVEEFEVEIDLSFSSLGANNSKTTYAESELGLLEIYGYDQNGAILFTAQVCDTNEYYEFTEPRVYIGGYKGETRVLDSGKNCPSPNKVTVKDDNGKQETKFVASGVYGDWNDLEGKVVLKRTKGRNDSYLWSACFYKYVNGKLVKTISTSNNLSKSTFPKGALNYLGFYIGKYGKNKAVDIMSINNVKVKKLNFSNIPTDSNIEIFKKGDKMEIDFNQGLVTINGVVSLTNIDIGSEFFSIPSENSQIAYNTDDKNASVSLKIQERFL